jgi:hypothetical protein
MVTSVDDPARIDRVDGSPKILLLVEDGEQNESLHHPIRAHILRVLSTGINDYETEITNERETLEDGTGVTRSIEVRRPIQRYWMAVPEIVEKIAQRHPEDKITSNQCYYHLQRLEKQRLVEQDPLSEFDSAGRKRRRRGLQYRAAARFFLCHTSRFSRESTCREFLQDGWGLEPSEEDCQRLTRLISEQEQTLFKVLERLVSHMSGFAVDSVASSVLLDRLAHLFLSDDDAFIARYRDAKRILVRSGGVRLDSDRTLTAPVGNHDAIEEETRGGIVG